MRDPLGAFCEFHDVRIEGRAGGPLSGLTFGLKDVFDVAGERVGAGNPDFLRDRQPAARTAPAVQALLDAGASLIGKTIADELCFSLEGENAHYGTPVNPNAPGRIPGGSSSGSASAVAGKLVDFALGTDTGGSVRLPASFCGIYGLRPTHGRISTAGMVPLSPSADTVGWFARDAGLMERVGAVVLGDDTVPFAPGRLLIASEALALADPEVVAAVKPAIDRLAGLFGGAQTVTACADGLDAWLGCLRTIQGPEIAAAHGAWIASAKPHFDPRIAERFAWAASVDPALLPAARAARQRYVAAMDELLGRDAVLCLPTVPGIAPLRNAPPADLNPFRIRALKMLGISGVAGTPQISLPVARVNGCPVGLSLIGPRGSDRALLALAAKVAPTP
jgi:amidase